MDRKSVNDRAAVVREKSLQLLDYEEIRRTVSKHTTYFIAQEMAVCMLPSYDCAQVERLQQETAEGRSLLKTSPNVGLENAADIRQQLNHTRLGGMLTGTDLVKVAHVIESLINLRRSILDCGDSIPIMIQIANKIPCLNHISHSVKSKIEPSGNVKDDATPALANLRLQVRESYERTKEALIEVVESHDQEDIFQDTVINIDSARPGILIGREGERVKNLRSRLEQIAEHRIQLNIIEIEQPELNPYLVGRNIAEQLQRRVAYRRAVRQAAQRAMQAGAQGIKIIVKGRISGAEIARDEKLLMGQVPLHTLRADIDYALAEAHTAMGRIGIKVWIYHGQILPALPEDEEELETIEVRVESGTEDDTEAIADDVIGGVATRGAFDVAT